MKNTLGDLNNVLFEQLERLNDDDMTEEQLDRELEKIIANGELAFKTMKHMDDYGYNTKERTVPKMLASDKEWKG